MLALPLGVSVNLDRGRGVGFLEGSFALSAEDIVRADLDHPRAFGLTSRCDCSWTSCIGRHGLLGMQFTVVHSGVARGIDQNIEWDGTEDALDATRLPDQIQILTAKCDHIV